MLERLSLTCCLGYIDRFQVKKKQFFRNFVAIMLFGVVGVFISFAIISAGCSFVFPKLGLGKLLIQDYLGAFALTLMGFLY
jgi:NhaP-type Na+/H+ or K+/H+ antiporter